MSSLLGLDSTPEEAAKAASIAKQANVVFILSLISILFCCLGGIIASVMANRAKDDAAAGNVESAQRNMNFAIGWMVVTYIVGLGGIMGQLSGVR